MKEASNSVEPNWGSLTFKAGTKKKSFDKNFIPYQFQLIKTHTLL